VTVFTLDAGIPQIALPGGYVVKFEAISPTTGAAITGVTVNTISIYGYDRAASASDAAPGGPYMFVPGPES
jgi:hypothetical protein